MIVPGRLVILAAACALAAACVQIKAVPVEKRTWVLEVPRPETATAASPRLKALIVRNLHISPYCEGAEFVYRRAANRLDSDFYNVFFIPPGQLITDLTRRWINQSGVVGEVLPPDSHLLAPHVLEGMVNGLHGDFTEPSRPLAIAKVQFLLLRVDVAPSRIEWSENFEVEAALPEATPAALVAGWNQCFSEILEKLEAALAKQ